MTHYGTHKAPLQLWWPRPQTKQGCRGGEGEEVCEGEGGASQHACEVPVPRWQLGGRLLLWRQIGKGCRGGWEGEGLGGGGVGGH